MYPYRVFVSYSSDDADKVEMVRQHLIDLGANPMKLPPGMEFADEIKLRIAYAHLFIVLLTAASKESPWVHQEIGYALGQNIAVLPLALDELPKGMAEAIQALSVRADLADLSRQLTVQTIENMVRKNQKKASSMVECADQIYERTRKIVELSSEVYQFAGPVKIREQMAFSSFSIPYKNVDHPDWIARDRANPRPPEVREMLRNERRAMEEHARVAGCDLIIDPYVLLDAANPDRTKMRLKHSPEGTAVRCRYLKKFLESVTTDNVRVVIKKSFLSGGLILMGDLCLAEAVVPFAGGGYRQTVFTRHGPTVLARVRQFDELFDDLLEDADLRGRPSRDVAIEELEKLIAECEENT